MEQHRFAVTSPESSSVDNAPRPPSYPPPLSAVLSALHGHLAHIDQSQKSVGKVVETAKAIQESLAKEMNDAQGAEQQTIVSELPTEHTLGRPQQTSDASESGWL